MTRNEVTQVASLQTGDRFYKLNDKKKTVLVMVHANLKRTHFRTYRHWCCEGSVMDSSLDYTFKERQFKAIDGKTQVVFLRHQNN